MAHRRVWNRRYSDGPLPVLSPPYAGDRPWVAYCLGCRWSTFHRSMRQGFGYAVKHVCGFR